MATRNRKGAAGADASVREFDDPEVLGLRREAAGVLVALRSRALDGLPSAADRVEASVVRPLGDLVADGATEQRPAAGGRREVRSIADRLVQLAKAATRLRARPGGAAPALVEATAALQDVALRLAVSDDAAVGLRRDFQKLQRRLPAGIQVSANGPYLVTNATNVFTSLGDRMVVGPQMALCRCGGSALKPLCDGTHANIGFIGAKDPARVPDRRDTYVGEQVTIFDNRGICAHSGFCTDRAASAFHTGGDPFVSPSGARMDELIRAVRDCPSGALSFAIDGREAREYVDQAVREPAIEVSKDGPYRVTGGVVLTDDNGSAVARVEGASFEHYSLCRCGQSQNKPFCSGRHWYVGFRDPPLSAEPSLFEWVGGLPALTRLVRRVLEKHVPEDELLAPLFADMAPDLPRRAAAWLGEAFGGPAAEDAVSLAPSLAGGAITEEQRRRAVALFERSADEVGLPADAQFRAAFVSYLEWMSRAVVEATQQGANPSALQPARKWDWTAAGKPASAAPAPGADGAEDALPSPLPGADEPILFDEHIKALFRPSDREAMRWAFDLSSYNDVAANAQAILQRLEAGSMPCDGAWAPEKVELFRRWVDEGTAESATALGAPQVTAREDETAAAQEPIGGRLGSLVKLRTDSPAGDRALVIEHREPLIYMLCSAAELEHALMCEYLFAAFTLKRSVDEGLTEDQLAAVERWRAAILMVAKQEMLHLAINCNLVNALGASPHLSRPNLPQPAKHYPPGVILTLLPFGEEALRHFIYLERPEGIDFDDPEGLAALEGATPVMGPEEIAPHLQEFATVGHLYRSIEAGFRHLGEKLGEDNLFVASAAEQVTGDLFGWPQLEPITNVDGAVRAIETIVEQGEGPRGDWRNAHFGRFLRVLDEYLAMMQANPGLEVARPVLPALVRPPESGAEADLITDPGTAAIADLCNVGYEVLLQLLYRLLCHVDESDAQMKTLSQVAIRLMIDVIEPIGELLTTLPVGPEHPGRTAGPSFELFYQPDYLLPHREAAWRIMAEHLADAGALAQQYADREPRLLPVAHAFQRLAETLRSQVDGSRASSAAPRSTRSAT
jgi:CDGSH-type Zn-finger protein/truncated hemoglobin YjbI